MAEQSEQEWLSTKEAGSRLGKTDRQVRRDCREGLLIGKKEGRKLLVEAASVEALAQEKGDADAEAEPEGGVNVRLTPPGETEAHEVSASEPTEPEIVSFAVREDRVARADVPPDGRAVFAQAQAREGVRALAEGAGTLREVFALMRTSIQDMQRREQAHCVLLCQKLDELEERLVFERRRNREMQQGLSDMLSVLGQEPEDVSKICIDARLEPGVVGRVWGWVRRVWRRWSDDAGAG